MLFAYCNFVLNFKIRSSSWRCYCYRRDESDPAPVLEIVTLLNLDANYCPNRASNCLRHYVSHSHERVGVPNASRLSLRPLENRNQPPKSKNKVFNSSKVVKPSRVSNLIPYPVSAWFFTSKHTKVEENVPTVREQLRKNFSDEPNVELVVVYVACDEQIGKLGRNQTEILERIRILFVLFF